jgi:phosphoglycerol geranylgeranyltransferase
MSTYQRIQEIRKNRGAGYFVLLDPDKRTEKELISLAEICEESGVDALLIGGSLIFFTELDGLIQALKQKISLPVILFPGSSRQLSQYADGVLFISILSGRNPHYLIGEQVLAAPVIHSLGIEPIATAYLLVESGNRTSAAFMSNTIPIPREKPDIAAAHVLAAEYLGFKWAYLEAGSGAELAVPENMIKHVKQLSSLPIIVGGGIKTPEMAHARVKAGADFIVTGNILEENMDPVFVKTFAQAIHSH